MASAPSASALSAVLRCRGNIWSRSPPTKRPAAPVRGLGLAGGARDASADRAGSPRESAWGAFLRGERVAVGGRLTVTYAGGKARGENDSRETNQLCHPRLSQPSGHARSVAPNRVQRALVRQLARRLTRVLAGTDRDHHMSHATRCQTYAMHVCKAVCAHQDARRLPAGAFKVSVKCPCVREDAGQTASLALTGWSTVKSTCLSLSALVSGFMCRSGSSPDDAPQHQQDDGHTDDGLQADGQILRSTGLTSNKDNICSQRKLTEDRPD